MELGKLYQWCCDVLQQNRPGDLIRLSDSDQISQTLQPGDIILVDGHSRLDEAIKTITSSRWSKAVLYLGRLHDINDPALRATLSDYLPCSPDTQLILDAQLDRGVHLDALSTLATEHLRICRPRTLSDADAQVVIRHAVSQLGLGSRRSWFAIMTILLPWGLLPRRWRCGVFSALAGSLLRQVVGTPVGEAFAFIQFPVLPLVKRIEDQTSRLYTRHPGIYFAADFDHSPYLDIIKYPFVDQIDHPRVRLQPWNGQASDLHQQHGDSERKLKLVD